MGRPVQGLDAFMDSIAMSEVGESRTMRTCLALSDSIEDGRLERSNLGKISKDLTDVPGGFSNHNSPYMQSLETPRATPA